MDPAAGAGAGVHPPSTGADWRAHFHPEARSRIINKITETLMKHIPVSVPDGLNELEQIAQRFEDKFYAKATNRSDYLRKIMKILSMETNTQHAPGNTQVISNQNNSAPGLPPQGSNQAPTSVIPLTSQQQDQQPNNSTSEQTSSLTNIGQNLPGVNQTSMMQTVYGTPHNTINNGLAQGTSQDIYAAQSQMAGRQQHQQSQQLIYHQQQMLMKQKLQQNSLPQPRIQQQQSLLQPTQMQSSQQSMMPMSSGLHPGQSTFPQTQPMATQSATQSGIQHNQLNSTKQSVQSSLEQAQQSVGRQQQHAQPSMHQQASLQIQQPNIPLQLQQQQLMEQQPNLQQSQLIGQQNGAVEMQQQQRLPVQSLNVQQTQQMLNQQYMPLHQPQQPGSHANMSSLQEVSSSTSADSTTQTGHAGASDWQEEIYQMIKRLNDQYFAELGELFNKICLKLQHVDSIIPPRMPSEMYDRMKSFKKMLDRILQLLQISKSCIEPTMRDKLPHYEEKIIIILNSQRRAVQRQIH